jgi:hypothetical protein
MRLIDLLDTDDTIWAPIRAARIAWLEARAEYERTGAGKEAMEQAFQRWQHVSREMRPDGQAPE